MPLSFNQPRTYLVVTGLMLLCLTRVVCGQAIEAFLSKQMIVEARVERVTGQQGSNTMFELRVTKVFCGAIDLNDTFFDFSRPHAADYSGTAVSPTLAVGQKGLWLLHRDASNARIVYRVPSALGVTWPVRESIPSYHQLENVLAMCRALNTAWTKSNDAERADVLWKCLDSNIAEIVESAAEVLSQSVPYEFMSVIKNRDLTAWSLSTQLLIDRRMSALSLAEWHESAQRADLLRAWLEQVEQPSAADILVRHFVACIQNGSIGPEQYCNAMTAVSHDVALSLQVRESAVGALRYVVNVKEVEGKVIEDVLRIIEESDAYALKLSAIRVLRGVAKPTEAYVADVDRLRLVFGERAQNGDVMANQAEQAAKVAMSLSELLEKWKAARGASTK